MTGKVISAEPGKKLVQSWQLKTPTWPSGESPLGIMMHMALNVRPVDHFGTMTITFDQGEDSTLSELAWRCLKYPAKLTDVPVQPCFPCLECPRVKKQLWKTRSIPTTFEGEFSNRINSVIYKADSSSAHSLKQMGLVLLSSAKRPATFQSTATDSQRRSASKTDVAGKKLKKRVPKSVKNAASTAVWTDYLGYATIAASAIGLAGIVWSSYQQK